MDRFLRCRWLVFLLLWGSILDPAAAAEPSKAEQPLLFNSIEFRGPEIGGWYNFSQQIDETLEMFARCADAPAACPRPDVARLMAKVEALRGADPAQVLSAVNHLANRRPYRLDIANFGQDEYWASPLEFLARSGDCEDFAIFKYALLRHLGLPAEALRVVLIERSDDGLGHAVLAVYQDGEVYILDNTSERVMKQEEVGQYMAVFSFNEKQRWAHFTGTQDVIETATTPRRGALVVATRDTRSRIPEEPAAPRTRDGSFLIQLGAFRVPGNAPSVWQRLLHDNPDLLGGLDHRIDVVDDGSDQAWHMLRVDTAEDEPSARALCEALRQRNVDCMIVLKSPS